MIKEHSLNTVDTDCLRRNRVSKPLAGNRVDILRQRINDENYLHAAIQRLALIMSKELMEFSKEGGFNERQRKKRK